MTERAQLQTGRLFRDLDGTIVHLKSILNNICVWTADGSTSDGACGGATHIDNFRKRFLPVPEPVIQETMPVHDEFVFLANQAAGEAVHVVHA